MAGETIRDVVIRIKLEQVDSKLKPPDVSEAKQAVASVATEAQRTQDAVRKNAEQMRRIYDDAQRQQEEALLKSADATRRMGEGFFTAARGLTLLAGHNEDLQVLVQNLALAQGAFDAYKGVSEIMAGVAASMEAAKMAANATAVSNTVLAASNGSVATSGAAAATSMTALQAAAGPIGLALLAVGAAAVGVAAAYRQITVATPDEAFNQGTESISRQAERLRELNDVSRQQNEHTQNMGRIAGDSLERQLSIYNDLDKKLAAFADKRKELEAFDLGSVGKVREVLIDDAEIKKLNEAQRALVEFQNSRSLAGDDAEGQNAYIGFTRQRNQLEQDLLQSQSRGLAVLEQQKQEIIAAQQHNQKQLSTLEDQDKWRRQQLDLDRQAAEQKDRALRSIYDQISATKELISAERQRVQSAEATIGALDPAQLAQLRAIAGKAKEGGFDALGREEREFLKGTLGGVDEVRNAILQREAVLGRGAGASDIIAALTGAGLSGEGSRLSRLTSNAESLASASGKLGVSFRADDSLASIQDSLNKYLEEFHKTNKAHLEKTEATIKSLVDTVDAFKTGMEVQNHRQMQIEQQVRTLTDAARRRAAT